MKIIILFCLLTGLTASLSAQVAINSDGSSPEGSAMLEVKSTDKGFLPPRMTTAQRDAIGSPAEGLTIFNTDCNCLQFYNGSLWFDACSGGVTPGPESDCSTPGFIAPFLSAEETAVVDVTNPATSLTWMDRNLGAMTAARSSADCWAYGNLYQWGRASEGHEDRSSGITSTNATTALPNDGNSWDGLFITEPDSPYDWLSPQVGTLWQGTSGPNNPCPAGYRLPTEAELDAERLNWTGGNNAAGAYASPLKLPVTGGRDHSDGSLDNGNSDGRYWSSTVNVEDSQYLYFYSNAAGISSNGRAYGFSVRCVKD
jgi:uncharacterized protein (TIGR02145 family)